MLLVLCIFCLLGGNHKIETCHYLLRSLSVQNIPVEIKENYEVGAITLEYHCEVGEGDKVDSLARPEPYNINSDVSAIEGSSQPQFIHLIRNQEGDDINKGQTVWRPVKHQAVQQGAISFWPAVDAIEHLETSSFLKDISIISVTSCGNPRCTSTSRNLPIFLLCRFSSTTRKINFPCKKIVKERINIVDCELHGASTVHEVGFLLVMPSFWKIEAAFISHKPGSWAHSISSFCFDYFRRYDTMPGFWKIETALIGHKSGSLLWLLWKIWSKV